MSREIKFRAWDKENEEIVRVDGICLNRNVFDTKNYIYGSQPHFIDEHNDLHLTEECVLMQYIGLKDKNGVDIYEGDIIKYGKNIFLIVYSENIASFTVDFKRTDKKVNCYPNVNKGTMLSAEVIGNIYTNKELLEVFND